MATPVIPPPGPGLTIFLFFLIVGSFLILVLRALGMLDTIPFGF